MTFRLQGLGFGGFVLIFWLMVYGLWVRIKGLGLVYGYGLWIRFPVCQTHPELVRVEGFELGRSREHLVDNLIRGGI